MNIDEMSDEEKSRKLVTVAGLGICDDAVIYINDPLWAELGMRNNMIRSLYDPANMALAWRVLSWAMTDTHLGDVLAMWWDLRPDGSNMLDKEPSTAQRLFLDKILELAIEAGLVEVDA